MGIGLALVLIGAPLVRIVFDPAAGPVGFLGLLGVVPGCGLGAVAVVRRGERSISVLAALPLWLFSLVLLVGEFVTSH